MPITVTFDDQEVLAVLKRIADSFTPAGMRGAMAEIGEELAESTRKRFATSTGPDGSPWEPLKEGTVLARYQKMIDDFGQGNFKKDGSLSRRGEGRAAKAAAAAKTPLVDTGALSRSINFQITDGGAGVEIGPNRTFDESKGVGPEVHQFGTRNGRIPARPFLGLSANDKTTVLDILNELLADAVK
ncbi:MAG: phage virion morphogenesis protein [Candidatus Accumulibacter sp.]|jgi:phage gpG-like protein|nr:phage virion morphogenesis protein [Accumulibacter sp.]